MEPNQQEHIRKNLPELIQLTSCNVSLVAYLHSRNLLSKDDVAELDVTENALAKAKLLYILLKKSNSYYIFCEALQQTQQTGALDVLKSLKSTFALLPDSRDTPKQHLLIPISVKASTAGPSTSLEKLSFAQAAFHPSYPYLWLSRKPFPSPPSYYIKRSLRSRYILQNEVFHSSANDVFVIDGIQKHQLTSLASGYKTDVSGNQIDELTVRHILLECPEDYNSLCKLSTEPVHWIQFGIQNNDLGFNSFFKVLKSIISVSTLQKHVQNQALQDVLTEEQLISFKGKLVIVSGSPGVGKTMLLHSIAQQKINLDSDSPILFVVMKDLVQELHKKEINFDRIFVAILQLKWEMRHKNEQLISQLWSTSYTLLLDGYDEVLYHQISTAKQILKVLQTQDLHYLYITTRPHMLTDLENHLHTLGFTIELFSETEQRNFFLRFWESEGVQVNDSVNNLATACLTTLAYKLENFERDIAGIPLQCKLLAEVYKDRAARCSQVKFKDEIAPTARTSIYEMYKRHIEFRIDKGDNDYESVIRTHIFYALELLFPESDVEFKAILPSKPILNSQILRFGILERGVSDKLQFIHCTFAEYFAAMFAFDKKFSGLYRNFILSCLLSTTEMKSSVNSPVGKLTTVNLFYFNHPGICYFINGFMKEQFQQYVDEVYVKGMLVYDYNRASKALIASAYHSYVHFPYAVARFLGSVSQFYFLPKRAKLGFLNSDLNFTELLIVTAMYSDVEMMELFCSVGDIHKASMETDLESFLITPLHIAVQRGNYRLVEYLLEKYQSNLHTIRYLLHFCVFDSQKDSSSTVDDKKQIIILLLSKNAGLLSETTEDGTIPILQKNIHLELSKCLAEQAQKTH